MKKTISHLPKTKQEDLEKISKIIQENCNDLEMVILFGSYARGDYKEAKDLKPDRKSGHVSDYDILAVTKEKETALDTMLWKKITEKCNEQNLSADVRIIAHDIYDINIKLGEGQYFYSDIKKEGCELYNSGNFELGKKKKLTEEEKKRIAKEHYDYWFDSAEEFFVDYNNAFGRGNYNKSAFYLNQAVESCYKTILLVFENYNPNEHHLATLKSMAKEHVPPVFKIFLCKTEEEEDMFKLLDYAYIGARYDASFKVTKEELKYMAEETEKLLKLTEVVCKGRIG